MLRKNIIKVLTIGLVLFLALPLIFEEEAVTVGPQPAQSSYTESGEDDLMGVIDMGSAQKGKALPKQDAGFFKKLAGKVSRFYTGGFAGRHSKESKFTFADASVSLNKNSSSPSSAADSVQSGMLNEEAPLPVRDSYNRSASANVNSGAGYFADTDTADGRQIVHRDIAVQGLYDASATAPYEERAKAQKAYSSVMRKIGAEATPSATIARANSTKTVIVSNTAQPAYADNTKSPVGIASKGSSAAAASRAASSGSFEGGGVIEGNSSSAASLGNIEALTAGVQADVLQAASEMNSFNKTETSSRNNYRGAQGNANANNNGSSNQKGSGSGNQNNNSSTNPGKPNTGGPSKPDTQGPNHNNGNNNPNTGGQGNNGGKDKGTFDPTKWVGCEISLKDTVIPAKKTDNPADNTQPQTEQKTANSPFPEPSYLSSQLMVSPPFESKTTGKDEQHAVCPILSREQFSQVNEAAKTYDILPVVGTLPAAKGGEPQVVIADTSSYINVIINSTGAKQADLDAKKIAYTKYDGESKDSFIVISQKNFNKLKDDKNILSVEVDPADAASLEGVNNRFVPKINSDAQSKNAVKENDNKKNASNKEELGAAAKDIASKKK